MNSPIYLVLSLREIANLHKIAKADVKAYGGDKAWCVVLRSCAVEDGKGQLQMSSANLVVNGCSLHTGLPIGQVAEKRLTPASEELFKQICRATGNWSGTPPCYELIDAQTRGNLTQLKKAKLVTTFESDGEEWISLTEVGEAKAAAAGIDTYWSKRGRLGLSRPSSQPNT